mmetsp:Transcript_5809/g.21989  ORF Transcript_5809/g.21989 Transcript_5809/m.21989 type:complete len:451 (-) Transcript_5809:77-1429(-)
MDELVEGVLTVGAGLAKVNLAGVVRQRLPVDGHALAVGLHRHLLDVRRQLGERLRVRQNRPRGAVEERDVPHGEQAERHRHVLLERRGGEVLVDVPRPFQKLLHRVETVLERQREHAHRGAHRVPTSDPVPKREGVVGVDAKLSDELEVGGHRHHVLLDSLLAEGGDDPLADGPRVEHRLRGGERLGHHHHQRRLRVEAVERTRHVDGIDVGEEAKLPAPGAVRRLAAGAQRGVHEERAEEGAADADGDDGGERLAGVPEPLAVANLLGEILDLVEDVPDVRDDVLTVDVDHLVARRARGDVEHGAVLRGVDVLAREHGVDLALEVRLVGEFVELRHRLLGDALPGVVAVHAVVLDGERLASLLVLDEVPEVRLVDLLLVRGEIFPRVGGGDERGGVVDGDVGNALRDDHPGGRGGVRCAAGGGPGSGAPGELRRDVNTGGEGRHWPWRV